MGSKRTTKSAPSGRPQPLFARKACTFSTFGPTAPAAHGKPSAAKLRAQCHPIHRDQAGQGVLAPMAGYAVPKFGLTCNMAVHTDDDVKHDPPPILSFHGSARDQPARKRNERSFGAISSTPAQRFKTALRVKGRKSTSAFGINDIIHLFGSNSVARR